MLLGRPILEMLSAVVDFLLVKGWASWVVTGKKSAAEKVVQCLKLADGVKHGSELMDVQFDLISEDNDHDQVETMASFLKDMHAESRYAQMTEVVQNFMQPNTKEPNMSDEILQADDDDFPEAISLPECTVKKFENIYIQ